MDANNDGYKDIIVVGNHYSMKVAEFKRDMMPALEGFF